MQIILLSLLCLSASAIGTVTGFGTSTIMLPLVIIYYPAQEALLFVSLLHWITGFTRLVLFRHGFDLRLVLSFGLAGIVTSYFGAKMAFHINEGLLTKIVGSFLLAYALFLILMPKFRMRFTIASGLSSGLLSGYLAGLFGMGGAVRAAFLSAFDLPKAVYLANSALILVLIDSTRVITYFSEGAGFRSICSWQLFFFYMVCSMLGVKLGELLVRRVPQDLFRYCVAGLLLVLGLRLLF